MSLADEGAKLVELAAAKSEAGTADSAAKQAWKEQEQKLLTLMARERTAGFRPDDVGYTFTAMHDKVKGQLDDRIPYLRAMLEQEPSIQELTDQWPGLEEALHEALLNLTFLKLAERQEVMNRQAREHHDDERPLPPGLGFRPVPYVSVVKHS